MKKRIFKNIDWKIFVCAILLCIIGTIALFSATYDSGYNSLQKQLIWFAICMPVVFSIIFIDYELIAKVSPFFYRYKYYNAYRGIIYNSYKWSQ